MARQNSPSFKVLSGTSGMEVTGILHQDLVCHFRKVLE